MADARHQPNYEDNSVDQTLQPPEQGSNAHILVALNDDCLQEVFRRLELLDLTRIAEVCKRFNKEAKKTFERKYKHLKLEYGSDFSGQPEALEGMFGHFGSSIQTLSTEAYASESETFILQLINRYCNPTLKSLELRAFDLEGNFEHIMPMLSRLETLTLIECTCYFVNVLSNCTELQKLRLENCTFLEENRFLEQQFMRLEEVHLISNNGINEATLERFLDSSTTLLRLSIDENERCSTSQVLRSIGENLTNLQELSFCQAIENQNNFQDNVQYLNRLTSLKSLKLDFNQQPVRPLMDALSSHQIPIEHIEIYNGQIDTTAIESLSMLKQVKTLGINGSSGLTDEFLVELGKKLPELKVVHLKDLNTIDNSRLTTIGLKKMVLHANKLSLLKIQLVYSIVIDIDDYKMMLKSVQNRPEKIALLIELTSDGGKVNVPEATLVENRNILYIDEMIQDEDERSVISNESNQWTDEDNDLDMWDDGASDDDMFYEPDSDTEDGLNVGVMMDGRRFYLG